jgi:flagellar basal-body rod protein FlgC
VSLFGSIEVSASGMSAQRMRAELLVENMANSETTRTPEGGPYQRKDVVFSSQEQTSPFSAVFQTKRGSAWAFPMW